MSLSFLVNGTHYAGLLGARGSNPCRAMALLPYIRSVDERRPSSLYASDALAIFQKPCLCDTSAARRGTNIDQRNPLWWEGLILI